MFAPKLLLYPSDLKDGKFKGLLSHTFKPWYKICLAHGFLNMCYANTYCVVCHHTPVISDKLNKSTNLMLCASSLLTKKHQVWF